MLLANLTVVRLLTDRYRDAGVARGSVGTIVDVDDDRLVCRRARRSRAPCVGQTRPCGRPRRLNARDSALLPSRADDRLSCIAVGAGLALEHMDMVRDSLEEPWPLRGVRAMMNHGNR